jgi:hypothetical protein
MNFLEGTRFSKAKHLAQGRPYRHLLKPKAGGIALAVGVLGEKFHSLLNVTIAYPDGAPTFWGFMCGRVRRVMVRVSSVEIPEHLLAEILRRQNLPVEFPEVGPGALAGKRRSAGRTAAGSRKRLVPGFALKSSLHTFR